MGMKNWQVRSNAQVHGLSFAAKKHQEACKREEKPSNFDAFYFAIFGKWPAKRSKQKEREEIIMPDLPKLVESDGNLYLVFIDSFALNWFCSKYPRIQYINVVCFGQYENALQIAQIRLIGYQHRLAQSLLVSNWSII